MARAREPRTRLAYALCDGVARGDQAQAIGIAVKSAQHEHLLGVAERVHDLPAARVRFAAIAEALRTCRRMGLDRVAIYCHDRSVVDQINRRQPANDETLAGCLECRALRHMFRKAEVRFVPWVSNLEATWLAQQAAAHPAADVASILQPTLPLTAAVSSR